MSAFLRKYGTGTGADIIIPMVKRGLVDFAATGDWTPASGDVKISKDGAAEANIGTLPVINGTYGWKFVFADAELQAKSIRVTIVDSATKVVEDQCFVIETYGNASAMYQADLSAASLPANVTQWLGTAPATPTVAGVPEVDVTHVSGSAEDIATETKQNTSQSDLDILTGTDGATLATSQPNYAPATSAQATAIEADTQDLQTQIGTAGAGLTDIPKAGYKLASDGLDTVATTSPAGVASNFREMVVATWRYLYKKTTLTATQLKAYDDAGTSAIATMTVSDDGSTQTKGEAS